MTERRRRGRPTEVNSDLDTSAAIAQGALHRFAAQGYEATSLREIATDAGVDISLISYRFGGKHGLWRAIVSQAADHLGASLRQALAEAGRHDARARLLHSARAFLAYLLARPEVPRLLLRDITTDTERSEWLLDVLSAPLHRRFIALAEAASEEGAVPAEHLQFRTANFVYSAASTVARRDRFIKLVDGIDSNSDFAAALEETRIEGLLGRD